MTARKLLLAAFVAALSSSVAQARPRPAGHLGGRAFEANKTFGLGLELGEPTGLNGKYFLSGDRALDFGIGDIYHYVNRTGIHIYGDYLFHPVSLAATDVFELPLYVGIGGRFWDFNDTGQPGTDNAYALGVRAPIGISMDFNNVPLDVFLQFVPVLDFYGGNAPHTIYLDFDVSLGVRYWFN